MHIHCQDGNPVNQKQSKRLQLSEHSFCHDSYGKTRLLLRSKLLWGKIENDENIMVYPGEKKELFANKKKFVLVYNSHYRIETDLECFKEEPLKCENIGSLDYFLFHLFCLIHGP